MEKTPTYKDDNTRDPRNPPLDPEEAEKLAKGAEKADRRGDQAPPASSR